VLAAIVLAGLCSGCAPSTKERTLRLQTHALGNCPAALDPTTAELRLTPLGDFPAPSSASEALPLAEARDLAFPEKTRAVAALVRDPALTFSGYREQTEGDRVDLLLWPAAQACELDADPEARPSAGPGQAMGYAARAGIVLIAGGTSARVPAGTVAAATFDAGNGTFLSVATAGARASEDTALAEPRAFATVTAFGDALLVAGGENPLGADSSGLAPASHTAEVFDPKTRRFAQSRIELTVARTRHAALQLDSGETLLIGGRGPSGAALNALETVSPSDQRASIRDLAALSVRRLLPSAFRLDDGRLFVAGGTSGDGTPLSALEWLSGDARTLISAYVPPELPPRYDRAFAPLPGGGVLAVGGCELTTEPCGGDCRAGCPPHDGADEDTTPDYDAWWITPNGVPTRLDFELTAPRPVLLGGADGMPLLSTGASGDTTLYRFNPWTQRFEAFTTLASPPVAGAPAISLDSGAFVWLDDGAAPRAFGLRSTTRNHLAIDSNLLTLGSTPGESLPLVPDRPTQGRVRFDAGSSIVLFDADSTATLYLASADYAAVSIDLTVEGDAPLVVLGTQELGGPDCPWPGGASAQFHVERRAQKLVLSSAGQMSPPCIGQPGRLRLGVKRGAGAFGIRHFAVTRQAE
jgi:hypothetical protein